ncbi:MAG: type II toxin-antitoxin system HicB family antitoxin [Candidatus Sungiibacteriota bacterium]
MGHIRYTIIFQPEQEGGFTVTVPALPGCITYGKDLAEAKKMAIDAIGAYLASFKKHHEQAPSETETLIASVHVKNPAYRSRQIIHA